MNSYALLTIKVTIFVIVTLFLVKSLFFKTDILYEGSSFTKKQLRQLKKLAKKGDIEAQITLGDAYYNGSGIKKNQGLAVELYLKAAGKGSVMAQLRLGDAYCNGDLYYQDTGADADVTFDKDAIQKNDKEAIRWYLKAAKSGNTEAQDKLLSLERRHQQELYKGKGVRDARKAEISYGEGQESRYAVLTADHLDVFKAASNNPDVIGKTGEEFISAIVKLGGISNVERYKDGKLNDGENGEAAIQTFGPNGAITGVMYHKDGKLNDRADGEAAFQSFNANGKVHRITHYKNGMRHDGMRGEAAFRSFDDHGELIWVMHYKEDKLVKVLNDREVTDYHELTKVTKSIETAIPNLKIY